MKASNGNVKLPIPASVLYTYCFPADIKFSRQIWLASFFFISNAPVIVVSPLSSFAVIAKTTCPPQWLQQSSFSTSRARYTVNTCYVPIADANRMLQTLLARNYRGDIPMSAVEKFPILLSEAEEESSAVPPCFSHEGINVTILFDIACCSL
jgi:hypothetical protein